MTAAREVMGSAYMNWAKTRSVAKYNLATSGLGNVKLSELQVSLDDLEITDGGKGVGVGGMTFEFNEPGQWAYFDPGDRHQISNTGDSRLELIEVEVRRK
jgi:hypothetical protein